MGSPFPRGPIGGGGRMGTGVDTADDILRIYMPSAAGKHGKLLWTGNAKGGLDGPDVPLLLQLEKAVDDAYPALPAPKNICTALAVIGWDSGRIANEEIW